MPRRGAVALLLTTAALALLLSFKTPAGVTPTAGAQDAVVRPRRRRRRPLPATPPGAATPRGRHHAGAHDSRPRPPPPPGRRVPAASVDGTIAGPAVATRWGTVQVQVTIAGGVITDVTALQLPVGDPHSADISAAGGARAAELGARAQSAEIDVVSGATYTSIAYAQSLQAALDAARA